MRVGAKKVVGFNAQRDVTSRDLNVTRSARHAINDFFKFNVQRSTAMIAKNVLGATQGILACK
jgi:hypothetical protein